jgi:hypothetical protein
MRVRCCERAPHACAAAAQQRRPAGRQEPVLAYTRAPSARPERCAAWGPHQHAHGLHKARAGAHREARGEAGQGARAPCAARPRSVQGARGWVTRSSAGAPHLFGVPVPAAPPPPRARRASQNACWAARTASASRGCGQSCGAGGAGGALRVRRRAPTSGVTRAPGGRGPAGRRGCM